jgi:hypothetical protein
MLTQRDRSSRAAAALFSCPALPSPWAAVSSLLFCCQMASDAYARCCFFLFLVLVCWVCNALLLFTYRALPAVNDATPVLHFFPNGGIHCVTLQYAVLLLVSTSVKESSAQWEYSHPSPTPKEATKNKYVSSYFPHPNPSLPNLAKTLCRFYCTRGFLFPIFVKCLDWSSSTSRIDPHIGIMVKAPKPI